MNIQNKKNEQKQLLSMILHSLGELEKIYVRKWLYIGDLVYIMYQKHSNSEDL